MVEIYKKEFAKEYDRIYKGDFYKNYAKFVKEIAEKRGIKLRVFDIACGTGRLIKEFRESDIPCEGMDISFQMIKQARKRNKGVKFYVQDVVKFNTRKKYSVITCTFDSINYIQDSRGIEEFFKRVKQHMETKSILVFDFNTIYKEIPRVIQPKPNIFYVSSVVGNRWQITITIKGKGKENFTEYHSERLYSFKEIEKSINNAGLEVAEIYSDFNNKIINPHKEGRIIIVATQKHKQRKKNINFEF